MIRVVLDANLLVSALFGSENATHILALARAGILTPILTSEIRSEYDEVLTRPGFAWSVAEARRLVRMLGRRAIVVKPARTIRRIRRDPADNRFLEAALAGRATFLITGNRRHFTFARFGPTWIVSPSDLLLSLF